MEFLKDNWIALLSLLIALLGGAPGIIVIIKYFREKSFFNISSVGTIIGNMPDGKGLMVMLSGTMSNHGEKPLIPDYFDLEIKIKGKWNKMEKTLIPEGAKFAGTNQNIQVNEPWKSDLQKEKVTITKDTPVYGYIMFFNKDIDRNSIDKSQEFKITCTDIYRKKYIYKFTSNMDSDIGKGVVYPKHGISIQPKDK